MYVKTQERKDLLKVNKEEMQQLFERRSKLEQDFMERYLAAAEDYHCQLEELRVADAEDYNVLKIRLETDIQNLEQHLEAMRATYQLNTEKLEYNYRVLVERDHENQSTINQQKRKISKQRDVLSNLKTKYNELDKKFQEENMKLMEEYKRTTEHFKELQVDLGQTLSVLYPTARCCEEISAVHAQYRKLCSIFWHGRDYLHL